MRRGRATARSPDDPRPHPLIRLVRSDALRPDEVVALRELFDEAWSDDVEGFTDQDWSHAVGGVHVIVEAHGRVVAHASVVQRELHTAGQRLRTGYVEAVATRPSHQRRGLGSLVIGEVGELIDRTYRLGALATGVVGFYELLGWVVSDLRQDRGRARSNGRRGRDTSSSVSPRRHPSSTSRHRSAASGVREMRGRSRRVGLLVPMDRGTMDPMRSRDGSDPV
jgi:aminoglycoside 2'-N-acetyltransferase I